jgi:Holliday junction resolvase RusA-like endonuclease
MNDKDNYAFPTADVECVVGRSPLAAKKNKGFDTPARIHVHSVRKRLCDVDGISAKAAIDGLVHCGILEDDSPKYVKEVTYSQSKTEKGEEERTEITIE